MNALKMIAVIVLAIAPVAGASHPACTPEAASWSTYTFQCLPVDDQNDMDPHAECIYFEERGGIAVVFGGDAYVVPGSGYALGDGSWQYDETWAVNGLQRGGIGVFGDYFPPGCDPDSTCILIDEDPITDENCGHGPDVAIGTGVRPNNLPDIL